MARKPKTPKTPTDARYLGELSNAAAQRTENLIEALVQWLFALWGASDYTASDEEALIDDTVEAVEEHILQARRDEDAYMKEVFDSQGLEYPQRNMPPASMELYPRRNTIPEQVWKRPLYEYKNARNAGDSHQQALMKTQKRVRQLADSEIRLAKRERAARTFERSGEEVIGYRRIIHPELSETGTCGLCLVAADRLYYREELYPLHDNCKCEVLPVTKSNDPGLSLNRADLDYIYDVAGGNTASKLSNTRIKEFQSGELGSVLARRVESRASGMTPKNEKYRLRGEDARRASRVADAKRQVRKAERDLDEIRSIRDIPKRARQNPLERAMEYWRIQAERAA